MKQSKLIIILTLIAAFLIGSCGSDKSQTKTDEKTTTKTESSLIELSPPVPAADFTLENSEGLLVSLYENKGKVLVISFWATWCHACKMEMDFLVKLKTKYAEKPFDVLSINVESSDMKNMALSIIRAKKTNFPVLFDTDSSVGNQYNPGLQLPYSVIVDKQGMIRFILQGFVPGEEEHIIASVEKLLGE